MGWERWLSNGGQMVSQRRLRFGRGDHAPAAQMQQQAAAGYCTRQGHGNRSLQSVTERNEAGQRAPAGARRGEGFELDFGRGSIDAGASDGAVVLL